jgi:hypothetical protein
MSALRGKTRLCITSGQVKWTESSLSRALAGTRVGVYCAQARDMLN